LEKNSQARLNKDKLKVTCPIDKLVTLFPIVLLKAARKIFLSLYNSN